MKLPHKLYLRHKGRLPVRLAMKPVIARKWRFIAAIGRQIGDS